MSRDERRLVRELTMRIADATTNIPSLTRQLKTLEIRRDKMETTPNMDLGDLADLQRRADETRDRLEHLKRDRIVAKKKLVELEREITSRSP